MNQMDDISFEVWDEDMTSSDLVGICKTKVFNILGPNKGMDEWHRLLYKGKSAGNLRLETAWFGAATAQAPAAGGVAGAAASNVM